PEAGAALFGTLEAGGDPPSAPELCVPAAVSSRSQRGQRKGPGPARSVAGGGGPGNWVLRGGKGRPAHQPGAAASGRGGKARHSPADGGVSGAALFSAVFHPAGGTLSQREDHCQLPPGDFHHSGSSGARDADSLEPGAPGQPAQAGGSRSQLLSNGGGGENP